jgi:hypothetical protein
MIDIWLMSDLHDDFDRCVTRHTANRIPPSVTGRAEATIECLTPIPRWSITACAAMVSFPVFGGTN